MLDSPYIARFVSTPTTATDAVIQLGWKPSFVIAFFDCQGTNPNMRYWADDSKWDWAAGANDSILCTGSTGVLTVDGDSITKYDGGDTVTATDVTNRKYFNIQGVVSAAGTLTKAGLSIPAGDQVASGVNLLVCFRDGIE